MSNAINRTLLIKGSIVFLLFLGCIFASQKANAQIRELQSMWEEQIDTSSFSFMTKNYLQITEKEFLDLYDAQPSFSMFRDNYFITGVPTNKEINNQTG